MVIQYHTSGMFKIIIMVIIMLSRAQNTDGKLGITWGKMTTGSLLPSMMVDMLLQNGIENVKLYNINDNLIRAFSRTNISLTIAIPRLDSIMSIEYANNWVVQKIMPFIDEVNIKYVLFGSNAFSTARFMKIPYATVPRSLKLLQNAIDNLGYGDRVKVIISHSLSGVLSLNNTRPSEAVFMPDVMEPMLEVLQFLNDTDTPFILDFFPVGYIQIYNIDMNFAFFDNDTYSITDVNKVRYHNALDVVYDSFVWALRKVGFGNLKIDIGQIGWPTDGADGATVKNAERFWKGLLPRLRNNIGTPMRPGIEIDVFVHSLVDEMNFIGMNLFARHWGVYRSNGEPKYKLDFTGQGRDIYPIKMMGTNFMPFRWCVLNTNNIDRRKVELQLEFACQNADCSTFMQGGSCGMLSHDEKVSYAFNNYFQANYQEEEACYFDGLGTVTVKNPSRDGCIFNINVVKGNRQVDPLTIWENVGDGLDIYGRKEDQ